MNNANSLRKQLIDAMRHRFGDNLAEAVFQQDLWPVLEKAIEAGELLVHRATQPQRPVADAIVDWLGLTITIIQQTIAEEKTLSKARLVKTLEQFVENGTRALAEARQVDSNRMHIDHLRGLKPGQPAYGKSSWGKELLRSLKAKGKA